jgi:phenylalanyl-tRNA synthetase beta chain
MDGVRVGPSPDWLEKRLVSAGMRPVNNIVDLTNYVLLEMGHPLHAFDYYRLRGGKIVVARAAAGQKMVTLDGVERELDPEMLLINDGQGPVAIAGVMGGLESEISEATHTILLECAYFQPASVRRTSKKLGLSTEASYRFERGADWDDLVPAIARTCYLIEQLAGGRIAGSLQDVYPAPVAPVTIELRRERAERLLGIDLTDAFIEETLKSLNFKLVRRGKGAWLATAPSYRADMELEADLIEEIARFHGYQNIPTILPPSKDAGIPSPVAPFQNTARRILAGLGHREAINLSFAAEDEEEDFPSVNGKRLAIRNPLTEETQFMRTSLAPGLVRSARRNFNHDQFEVRLFEIGKIYRHVAGSGPAERNTLGILGTGSCAGLNWQHPQREYGYFHLKGVVAALLTGMRSGNFEILPAADVPWLHPGDASFLAVEGRRIGVLGSLHPALEEKYKLKQPVYLAEIDFEELSHSAFKPMQYVPLARYPAVERDLSFVVARDVPYGTIRTGLLGLGLPELIQIELIDVYEGERIPAGKRSLTLRLTFQDASGTLTVDRVQGFSDNLVTFLRNTYGAALR